MDRSANSLEDRLLTPRSPRSLSRLVGGVAHDLNNLLAVIICNLELLDESDLSEPVRRRLVEPCLRSALGSAELTQQLLTLARGSSGRPRTMDLGELIEGMLPLLRRATGGSCSITVEKTPDLWPCALHLEEIQNTLVDLVANYHENFPGEGELRIALANIIVARETRATGRNMASGEYVVVTIGDARACVDEVGGFMARFGGYLRADRTTGAARIDILLPALAPSNGAEATMSSP